MLRLILPADLVNLSLVGPLGVDLLVFDVLAEDGLVLVRLSSSPLGWC